MSWTILIIIIGAIVIEYNIILLSLIERIKNLESSVHTLWGSVNRLGDNNDELRARAWKLEHKDDAKSN